MGFVSPLQELRSLIEGGEIGPGRARVSYRPTAKGLDLLPAIIEMIVWAARYEETAAPPKILRRLATDRAAFIAEIRSQFSGNMK